MYVLGLFEVFHIYENEIPSLHHGIWGDYKQWWFYASIHLPSRPYIQQRDLHQKPGGGSAALDQESGCWKTLHLATGFWIMPHQQENPVLPVRKFWQLHHPKRYGCLTPQIAIPLIIMCGVQLSENLKKLCDTKDELKERIMAAFSSLNKETIRKACRKFQSCLVAMGEASDDFFE